MSSRPAQRRHRLRGQRQKVPFRDDLAQLFAVRRVGLQKHGQGIGAHVAALLGVGNHVDEPLNLTPDADHVTIDVCGSFPGNGPNTVDCATSGGGGGPMKGNYRYIEIMYPNGTSDITEVPQF